MAKTDENWIDWRRVHPDVCPEDIDAIDRAQIAAQQQASSANVPLEER